MSASFSDDDARLDQRLSLLWDKITRISREVMTLKPRLRTIEKRLDRIERPADPIGGRNDTPDPTDRKETRRG
ncbi:hypothetical protein MTQ12_01775 [Brevibacterium sp. R8603A2]|uniref:hypothetical protein n=1 Tax=Brevibacterium sp. R8603A2 TaxID=2929779 RepID=UPI001FFA0E6E|nr:hypothetical protein [Brevibacterium sp. R8603A2]MCK1801789.1 hypothetical protein [Brevibacterium sp. R8603A2]